MKNQRASFFKRTYIVEHAFQVKFILKIVSFVVFATLFTGLVTYFVTNEALERSFYSIHYQIKNVWQILLPSVVIISFVTTAIVAFFTTIVALVASHRVGGPLYRFRRSLKEIEGGDLTKVTTLRERDELKEFVGNMNSMVTGLREKVTNIDVSCDELSEKIEAANQALLTKEGVSDSDKELLKSMQYGMEALKDRINQFTFKG